MFKSIYIYIYILYFVLGRVGGGIGNSVPPTLITIGVLIGDATSVWGVGEWSVLVDRFCLTQTIHFVFVFGAREGVHMHDVGLCFVNVIGTSCNFVKQPTGKRPNDHTTKRANENIREFWTISDNVKQFWKLLKIIKHYREAKTRRQMTKRPNEQIIK